MAIFLQDLDQRFPIVDADGRPTDYFLRLLRGQTGDLADGLTDADAAITALQTDVTALEGRNIDTGFGLSGGGDLSADRTISLGDPALTDPGADRGLFWDDSAGKLDWLTFGSGLTLADQTLTASGGGGSWSLLDTAGAAITAATVTITIASPGVVTLNSHGFAANQAVVFRTTGALPTGLTAGTTYYVRNPAANTFEVSATVGGASINTTGTQSGTHSVIKAASWVWSTNVANVDFTNLDTYQELMVVMRNVSASVSGQRGIQLSIDNGSSYFSTGADYNFIVEAGTDSASSGITMHGTPTTAARSGMLAIRGSNLNGAMKTFETINRTSFGGGLFTASTAPISAVRAFNSGGGNLTGGIIYLLGR